MPLQTQLPPIFDLPQSPREEADVLLLPLPFEGTVSYGAGTARGPAAVWEASAHVETWDEETDFDLESLRFHTGGPVLPVPRAPVEDYLERVRGAASDLGRSGGLVIGIGGEHSLTPPLAEAACGGDASAVTVVQFDAHPDLRSEYGGTPHSHACAMRRLVERGANVLAIGIRSADREEWRFGRESGRVRTFPAQHLAESPGGERALLEALRTLRRDVYLTFDIDVLEVHLCSGTGTPQPGGLSWWQTLRYLRALLMENRAYRLIGCDLVETAPLEGSRVNEFTAARLLAKMVAYRFAPCPKAPADG